jgi:phage/plasmid-like protein (TIGR03299 family)
MSHELTQRNGKTEAAFAGKVPWHGLGHMVEKNMTALEALELAGLNWDVIQEPLFLADGTEITDRLANVRSDGGVVGTVSPTYQVIQNTEQAEFIDAVCGEGGAYVECAGSLTGGKKVFWTIDASETTLDTSTEDVLKNKIIFTNSHDATSSFKAYFSTIRVVCQNTLTASLREIRGANHIKIQHSKNAHARMRQVIGVLKAEKQFAHTFAEIANRLAGIPVNQKDYETILSKVFGNEEKAKSTREVNRIITSKAACAKSLKTELDWFGKTSATAWDALNSVTYFTSHILSPRTSKIFTENEAVFNSTFDGSANKIQQKALDVVRQFAEV